MAAEITIFLTKLPTTGSVNVIVKDKDTNAVIPNATVTGGGYFGKSNTTGVAIFNPLPFGTYTFTASKDGYDSNTGSVTISLNQTAAGIVIYLTKRPTTGTITVIVRDKNTNAVISGAAVAGNGYSGSTNASGTVSFASVPFGTYNFAASKYGYSSKSSSVTISESATEKSVTIHLSKINTDVGIETQTVNGTVYRGSTIMVSAKVLGDSALNFTPSMPLTVTMKATRNGGTVFDTQSKTVICPKGDSNLVWFTVEIPQTGYTSADVTFTFTVKTPASVSDSSVTNNNSIKSVTTYVLADRDCEDAGLATTAPSSFTYARYNKTEYTQRSWTVYEWNGGFVKKTYTAVLDMSAKLIPNANAGYRAENGGVWTTRSGYGVDTEITAQTVCASSDIVGTLKIDAFYPEHNYSTAVNKSDRLELLSGKYVFAPNSTSVNSSRMHGTPLWFPGREYAVKYYAFDLWCPAGMLSGYTNAYVVIDGDMFDDLYTG